MLKKILQSMKSRKISILMVLVIFTFVGLCFAQKSTGGDSTELGIADFINFIIGSLSWIWIILVTIAGKFMTNSVIYGSFLHLDAFFIKWWNLIKNIANFALAFILIFKIAESLINKKTQLKEVIKRVLVAGILIQSSWFLLAGLLDLSTILVSSFGTLPAQVIVSDDSFRSWMNNNVATMIKNKKMIVINNGQNFPSFKNDSGNINNKKNIDTLIDSILPNENSLSGPLLFLGISILDIQDLGKHDYKDNISEYLIDIGISGFVLLIFTFIAFLLFIFNFLRVFVLWVVIPLSPLVILFFTMKIKIKGSLGDFFDPMKIIKLIFMPVIFVAYISLIMMFLVSIKGILKSGNIGSFHDADSNITLEENFQSNALNTSSLKVGNLFSFTVKGAKNSFSDLILYIFTLIFLSKLVIMTFQQKTGFKFIDNTMEDVTSNVQKYINSVPVVPIPGKGNISLKEAKQGLNRLENPQFLTDEMTKQTESVNKLLGYGTIDEQAKKLINSGKAGDFYTNEKIQKDLITKYGINNGDSIKKVPIFLDWFEKYAVDANVYRGDPTKNISNMKVKIGTGIVSVKTALDKFGFNKNGKYIGKSIEKKT